MIFSDCDRLGQIYLKAYKDTAAAFKVFEKNCYVNQFGASCLTVGDYYYTGSHRKDQVQYANP